MSTSEHLEGHCISHADKALEKPIFSGSLSAWRSESKIDGDFRPTNGSRGRGASPVNRSLPMKSSQTELPERDQNVLRLSMTREPFLDEAVERILEGMDKGPLDFCWERA